MTLAAPCTRGGQPTTNQNQTKGDGGRDSRYQPQAGGDVMTITPLQAQMETDWLAQADRREYGFLTEPGMVVAVTRRNRDRLLPGIEARL